jgi:hypothetical protein
MKNVLISYDLHKLGQRYHALRQLIEQTFSGSWACLDSTYIVRTTWTCAQVRDLCAQQLDDNDELLVIELAADWATLGMRGPCSDWLRANVAE